MLRLITLGGVRLERDGAALPDVRPRRLALLAILAAAGPNGIARESVLAILWSESSPERARHSLAQAVYSLRRELDVNVVTAGAILRLDQESFASDVGELRAALDDARFNLVDRLYAGPFLDGFYLSEAPEFERWVDDERARLHRDVLAALERSAVEHARIDSAEATRLWRRLTQLDPLSGRFAAESMKAMARAGDRAGALARGQAHVQFIEKELGVHADDSVLRLLDELRIAPEESTTPPVALPVTSPPADVVPPRRARSSLEWARASQPYIVLVVSLDRVARYWKPATLAASLLLAVGILGAVFWPRADASAIGRPRSVPPVVARLYEGGRRAFYRGEYAAATRLFTAALAEDPDFIPATYFAWRSELASDGPGVDTLAARLLARAGRSAGRDPQLIAVHVGLTRYDIRAAALAESLSKRFPDDADILMRGAEATGDLARSVTLLERSIQLDSADASSATGACRACEALQMLATRYAWADSSSAVLRTLDRWSAMRPLDYTPWSMRFEYLVKLDRHVEAADARRRADSLGAPHGPATAADVERAIRASAFDAADSLCRVGPSSENPPHAAPRFRRFCALNLRAQGRLRAALALTREIPAPWTSTTVDALTPDLELGAALDLDMDRPLVSAAWHSRAPLERSPDTALAGVRSHALVWHLTEAATALAQAGDTIHVRALVDSVELVGHRSADPRDPLLHHFLRGLLLSIAREHEAAVREFRLASVLPARDFARIHFEMARSLVAARRPLEAIPSLRAVLHGDLDGAGLTLSPTDVRLALAEAFEAAGSRDSAAVHYAAVEHAWRNADPVLSPRYQAARVALARTRGATR